MLNSHSPNKYGYILLASLLTLVVFLILFVFRALDDNRLTSWQWTFAGVDIAGILSMLVLGIVIAYALSKTSFPEHRPVIFLFLCSFVIGMSFWKEPEVIIDVSRYFTQAKHLKVYGIKYFIDEWGRDINVWTDLPLVPFIYGLIFRFFGESRIYIQVFTTFLFSMTAVLTYLIGKTLWDESLGFTAGILLLGIPYLFTQVPLMLVDIPTMFFLTFSIFTFIKAIEKGKAWIIISSFALFLAFFTKYSTWLMLSVLVIISLVYLRQGSQKSFRKATHRDRFASAKSRVAASPLYAGQTGGKEQGSGIRDQIIYRSALVVLISCVFIGFVILFKFDVFSRQIYFLFEYQRPGLRRWGESFFSIFFYQMHPFVTIASIYSIYAAFRKRDLKYAIVGWLVLLAVLLQIKRIRYIMIMFPMFVLMASYGFQEIKTRELRRFLALCAVISSIVLAVFIYLPFLQKMSPVNLKDAGGFLNSFNASYVEVLTLPSTTHVINPAVSVPILDLFTDRDIYYNNDVGSFPPPFEKIKESSLRFTWEYKNPGYYSADSKGKDGNKAIVVISSESGQSLPDHIAHKIEGFKKSGVFKASVQIFRYVTIVEIYQQGQKNL